MKRFSNPPQGVAQVVAGSLFRGIGPNLPGELLPPESGPRMENQKRKQRLCGTRWQGDRFPTGPDLESSEQPHFEHLVTCLITDALIRTNCHSWSSCVWQRHASLRLSFDGPASSLRLGSPQTPSACSATPRLAACVVRSRAE